MEKYWEVRPSLIYIYCKGISHNHWEKSGDRALEFIICQKIHNVEDYTYGITRHNIQNVKICTHVTPQYTNCDKNYSAIAFKCPTKLKA